MDTIAKAVLNRLLARFIKGFNLDVSLRSGSAELRDVEVWTWPRWTRAC